MKRCKPFINLGRYIQYQTNQQVIENRLFIKTKYICDTSHDTKIFLLSLL